MGNTNQRGRRKQQKNERKLSRLIIIIRITLYYHSALYSSHLFLSRGHIFPPLVAQDTIFSQYLLLECYCEHYLLRDNLGLHLWHGILTVRVGTCCMTEVADTSFSSLFIIVNIIVIIIITIVIVIFLLLLLIVIIIIILP